MTGAPQCPPILTREQLVARMAYAISPYAWGYIEQPKLRAYAQANAKRAAEMALREVELAVAAHLGGPIDDPVTMAARAVEHLIVRRKA